MKIKKLITILAASTMLAIPAARAAVSLPVLVIDISNPAAVTFTSTTENASNTFSTPFTQGNFFPPSPSVGGTQLGISLAGFFSNGGTAGVLSPASSTLAPGPFYSFGYSMMTRSVGSADLRLSTNVAFRQEFSTSNRAFTGALTVDLSAYAGQLPTAGSVGSILAPDASSNMTEVGSYQVVGVPECSSFLLSCSGALVLLRRRR